MAVYSETNRNGFVALQYDSEDKDPVGQFGQRLGVQISYRQNLRKNFNAYARKSVNTCLYKQRSSTTSYTWGVAVKSRNKSNFNLWLKKECNICYEKNGKNVGAWNDQIITENAVRTCRIQCPMTTDDSPITSTYSRMRSSLVTYGINQSVAWEFESSSFW